MKKYVNEYIFIVVVLNIKTFVDSSNFLVYFLVDNL